MIITAITPQKRRRDRVNIFIDDAFAFSLDLENMVASHLHKGQSLTESERNELLSKSDLSKWQNRVLHFLSFRPRSKKELVDYFVRNEIGKDISEKILQKLEKLKLVDDLEFSKWFISERIRFRPKGKKYLEFELRKKGIEQSTIDEVLETTYTQSVEEESAYQLVLKKNKTLKNSDPKVKKQKIMHYMAYRGFQWNIIETAIRRLNQESVDIDASQENR